MLTKLETKSHPIGKKSPGFNEDIAIEVGMTHYRHYLQRYVETAKQRRPSFNISGWAKAMGLKSTSTLTKILNGEREAGPEVIDKLVRYFKFNALEEAQFKNLVALSKLKESTERKNAIAEMLLQSQALKELA